MPLNAAQQKAVEYLEGPLLVLAGPGTGKTQLLSSKVVHILENTDANPENILCLTYTDAGAINMRNRLNSIIGTDANDVNIFTYHSFGTNILGQYKNYAEHFDRNLDDPIDNVTQYKIISDIIDTLPVTDFLKNTKISDIISTISEAKAAQLSPLDLQKITETNLADSEAIADAATNIFNNNLRRAMPFDEAMKDVYNPIGEVLADFVSKDPIVKNIEKEANLMLRALDEASKKAVAEAEEYNNANPDKKPKKPSVSHLTAWRNAFFEKANETDYRLKNYVANKKTLSFSSIMARYQKHLEDNKLFDFSDMIQESINILRNDKGFCATLSERYQYIMLDEFQDTNPSQFELIRLITNYDKPVIMAVGDDDQAIFAFQGANASNLMDFQTAYNAEIITLTENYRSTSEILDFSHKIADQIPDSFAKKYGTEKVLSSVFNDDILVSEPCDNVITMTNADKESSNEPDEKPSLISRHEFIASDAEYSWVANQIHALIQSGEKQSDIAIITPKHKYITPLLPYIKAYDDINISYEKRENVLEDQYIHEITTLARFIYELSESENPAHRLMEIFTFPFFGISPISAITALQTSYNDPRKALDFLTGSKDEKIQQTAAFIAEMVKLSFTTPLEEFIDCLVGTKSIKITLLDDKVVDFTSPFIATYSSDETNNFDTFNLYENLHTLRERITKHVSTEKPRLRDLIAFLDDYEIADQSIINTSPYRDSNDSIQILSAHKSKGLEFKHVFIIAADDRAWGNSKGNNNQMSLPKNLACIRHTGSTDEERLRLYFVAITRAKKTLTITNSLKSFDGKPVKRLAYMQEYNATDDVVVSPLLPNTNVVEHYDVLPESERRENIQKNWLASYINPAPNLRPILEERVKNYKLNATDLTTFIDVVYGGPLEFYKRKILHGPSEPATNSLALGNAIHATFEAITKGTINEAGEPIELSDADAEKYLENYINNLDVSEEDRAEIMGHSKKSLAISLKAFGSILRAKNSRAEVNFSHEHLVYNDAEITGKIDHINIDEENKTIELYDFKTSKYYSGDWDKKPPLYKYQLQLNFYKLLLNLSPTFKNYKVTKAHILFVNPSVNDIELAEQTGGDTTKLVFDKVYDFTEAGEQDLRELIDAVNKHIKALDFIDESSPLAIYPDSGKTVEDIKDFCKLVKETSL